MGQTNTWWIKDDGICKLPLWEGASRNDYEVRRRRGWVTKEGREVHRKRRSVLPLRWSTEVTQIAMARCSPRSFRLVCFPRRFVCGGCGSDCFCMRLIQ